jgi:sulfite reductase (ferredoxin)
VVELAKKYGRIPNFEEDKNPYFDFSENTLFSLKARGAGECSAGMYDLIEADEKALKAALQKELNAENLSDIRLLSARMLLITRGEDARSEKEVLTAFKKLFIDTGLISSSFERLLEGEAQKDVVNLAHAVIALYATMDNSLKFATETKPDSPASNSAIARVKDYRGVACPMNFVKTKMDLAQMNSGETFEILLDDGEPIANVPKSVMNEGHIIKEQIQQDNFWRVRILKK